MYRLFVHNLEKFDDKVLPPPPPTPPGYLQKCQFALYFPNRSEIPLPQPTLRNSNDFPWGGGGERVGIFPGAKHSLH